MEEKESRSNCLSKGKNFFASRTPAWRKWLLGGFAVALSSAVSVWAISAFVIGTGENPAVSADGTGEIAVVWEADDGHGSGIKGRFFTNFAMPLGIEFQVNSQTAGEQVDPDVAFLSSGDAVVVWQTDAWWKRSKIVGQRIDSFAMPLGSEFEVSQWGTAVSPVVGADDHGRFYVVWAASPQPNIGNGPKFFRLFARAFDSWGNPLGPAERFGGWVRDIKPAVGVSPSGEFVVIWEDFAKDLRGLMFDNFAMPLGIEFEVGSSIFGRLANPAIVFDGDDFLVAWDRDHPWQGRSVRARPVSGTFAMPLGIEYQVSVTPFADDANPRLAIDASGRAVVTWQCLEGSSPDHGEILARQIDTFAMPLGIEFQVDQAAGSVQRQPAIASDTDGGFVVVWEEAPSAVATPNIEAQAVEVVEDP